MDYPQLFDDVKRAWAVWTVANQSYASKLNGNWGYDRKENRSAKQLNSKRKFFTNEFAERLGKSEIECADALRIIQSRDSKESFFYCDPPYINTNQGLYNGYTKDDFEKLLRVLSGIKGKFLLSSYSSKILTEYTKSYSWSTKEDKYLFIIGSKFQFDIKKEN